MRLSDYDISENLSSEITDYDTHYSSESFSNKIITHQIWKGGKMPEIFEKYRNKWIEKFPNYEHLFHKDDELRNLIKDHYSSYLDFYDSMELEIERIDFFRCALLHHYGGIYIDLDMLPLKPLDYWVEKNKIVFGFEPKEHLKHWEGLGFKRGENIIGNAIMISPKNNKFWLHLMEYIRNNYRKGRGPVYNTGPICISYFYIEYPNFFKDVIITEPNCFYPITSKATQKREFYDGEMYYHISESCEMKNAYTVHLWSGSWRDEKNSSNSNYIWFIVIPFIVGLLILLIIMISLQFIPKEIEN